MKSKKKIEKQGIKKCWHLEKKTCQKLRLIITSKISCCKYQVGILFMKIKVKLIVKS